MAVTSGFFNSVNGDRKYDALQMAELFDGLINDGVYETLYNKFKVSVNEGLAVQVDTGRGWFQHTWIKNDGIMVLQHPQAEILFDRIDAVVIEVNHNNSVREDTIKIVKGTPSANPVRPTLQKSGNIYQYPLAYVRVKQGATAITTADITNAVGTSECPFVTGVVSVMDIDMLVEQWRGQWLEWFGDKKHDAVMEWDEWFHEMKDLTGSDLIDWIDKNQNDFIKWFESLQVILEGDVAANLANEVLRTNQILDTLARERRIYRHILDNNDEMIADDDNDPLIGSVDFACHCCC